ncbi:hypothetical protein PMEGAPL103_10520 [Priestia megaterium]
MIREILASDAAAFLALNKELDRETAYMLYEENERAITLEQQKKNDYNFFKDAELDHFSGGTRRTACRTFICDWRKR